MKIPLYALLLLLAPTATPEAEAFGGADAGTSAGQFLKLGGDARAVAMGESAGAVAEDSTALYWNPAGLAALTERHATFTHAMLYESVYCDFTAYAHPVRSIIERDRNRRDLGPDGLGSLAVGALYLNAGQLQETDNTGVRTGGAFTPRDLALMAGWGAPLTRVLDAGFAFKYIDSRIKLSARTTAVDGGVRLRLHAGGWPYRASVSVHNVGPGLRFREKADPLPTIVRVGQSLRPLPEWTLSSDVVLPRDGAMYPSFGSETRLTIQPGRTAAALRLGWSGRTSSSDLDGLTGISFGMGLTYLDFRADYAWAPFGVLGSAHRLSLSYSF